MEQTFQNVNRRLLTWETVFSAYPDLKIVHQAGRVHSNVDPISRLQNWVPFQSSPSIDATKHIILDPNEEPLIYGALGEWFEEKLLKVSSNHVAHELTEYADYSKVLKDSLEINLPNQESIISNYHTSETYSTLVSIHPDKVRKWKDGYKSDHHLSRVLKEKEDEEDTERNYSQYLVKENSLIYFEGWMEITT